MIFYKHFLGDYQKATAHLSLLEHGVYRQMLDHFYALGQPLPSKAADLCRLIRANDKVEKTAVEAVAAKFWLPLPANLSDLREILQCYKEDDQELLRRMTASWTVGELINARAVSEMMDYFRLCETNRIVAINREQKRRDAQLAAVGGRP